MLSSKQRAYLRKLANPLSTIFHIGKNGLTPEFTKSVEEALDANELIKIDVLNNSSEDPKQVAEMIAGRTHSEVVQVIGKKIVLYKKSKDNAVIKLP